MIAAIGFFTPCPDRNLRQRQPCDKRNGPSEFHVSKPDGWTAGDYQVEIFAADKFAGGKTFTVK